MEFLFSRYAFALCAIKSVYFLSFRESSLDSDNVCHLMFCVSKQIVAVYSPVTRMKLLVEIKYDSFFFFHSKSSG